MKKKTISTKNIQRLEQQSKQKETIVMKFVSFCLELLAYLKRLNNNIMIGINTNICGNI